jgi:DNA-binding CsgD family transcriptional regulator
MALGLHEFSDFICCLNSQAQETDGADLAGWAVEHLSHVIGFDSAWYGWAEISNNQASIRAQSNFNLPDDYYDFWRVISADDLLVRKFTANPLQPATYERRDRRQTEGMTALSDRYKLNKIVCSMAWRAQGVTSLFISTYRSGRWAQPFSDGEIDFLQCAAEQISRTMRRSLGETQGRRDNGGSALLVNGEGRVLVGLDDFRAEFGSFWPDWKGDLLPERLRALTAMPGQHYLIDRKLAVSVAPEPNRAAMPIVRLSVRRMNGLDLLTEREREVARLLAAGKSHKETARLLGVAPATVRNQTQMIYAKLNINNRASLASLSESLSAGW